MLARIMTPTVLLRLYTNDKYPVEGDLPANYTEMSGMGYAAISLAAASWTIATANGISEAVYPQQTFTFVPGAGTVLFGYYVTDADGTTVLWAERFTGAPFVIPAGGGTLTLTPVLRLD